MNGETPIPFYPFPGTVTSISNGGISAAAFQADAIGPTAIATTARGQVKYIYRGVVTIAGGSTSGTATIPQAVDVTKTELYSLGQRVQGAAGNNMFSYLDLTNGTTVTATRGAAAADATNHSFQIVERY